MTTATVTEILPTEVTTETATETTEKAPKAKKPKAEKAPKPPKAEKPPKPEPVHVDHPKAEKLDKETLRKAVRGSFGSLWTIEGHLGLFQYIRGCKNGTACGKSEIVGDLGDGNHAVFSRDHATESVVAEAMGVTPPAAI